MIFSLKVLLMIALMIIILIIINLLSIVVAEKYYLPQLFSPTLEVKIEVYRKLFVEYTFCWLFLHWHILWRFDVSAYPAGNEARSLCMLKCTHQISYQSNYRKSIIIDLQDLTQQK